MNVIVTKSSYAYRENFDLADKVVDDLEVGGVGLDARARSRTPSCGKFDLLPRVDGVGGAARLTH